MEQHAAVPTVDQVTEILVLGFIDLINERRLAGKPELAATMETIATWLSERTGLTLTPRHIQILVKNLEGAQLITIGGGGIGQCNTYLTREDEMGAEMFWNQVDTLLMVWKHPSSASMRKGS